MRDGDVVIAKITPCFENGKGAICRGLVNSIGFGTTELHVLRTEAAVSAEFIFYLTKSHNFRSMGTALMKGSAGQQRVPEHFVKDFRVAVPPRAEQDAIVAFLDRKLAEIERFIRAKERLIALLKEQKAAIINRVITKGLDPNVPMKPSGIAWLGEIPEHWEIVRLGSVLRERRESNLGPKTTNVLSVLKDVGVINYEDKGDIGNKKSDDIERYRVVHVGDLVLNSMNVIIGSVGISHEYGALSPVYYVLVPSDSSSSIEYYGALFQSRPFQKSLKRIGFGILDHRLRIPMNLLRVELVPRPPYHEQEAIVTYVNSKVEEVEQSLVHVQREIELIKEYRTTLISDVVTGKIDVRASVPEEALV